MAGRKVVRTKPRQTPGRAVRKLPSRTLAAVVGQRTYDAWVEMLHTLVPHGRTHRLSVVVAAMLQHAAAAAYRTTRGKPAPGSVAAALLSASARADPEELARDLADVLEHLFRDAKVSAARVSARGEHYSIFDGALREFVTWENMPWE